MRAGLAAVELVAQAEFIERVTKPTTSSTSVSTSLAWGDSVAQLVEMFFPNVTRYRYTPDLKSAMVRQTQQIIRKQRQQFTALALDFLTFGNATCTRSIAALAT
ncbi:hypothetical protein [Zymobacter palmae]|uniref:Uncharacterized protein n=1 Tax=Zymobacter palmae TaxID=33074 RepID=A0A348HCW1_9GAMM|nr:hypothetical protein [Zymobacter palmae]BBG29463.1 hypothetical protein ZBT109_0687 [Zymobacter palmae]